MGNGDTKTILTLNLSSNKDNSDVRSVMAFMKASWGV